MRGNHVLLRTCVACRTKGPQRDFVRITRRADAVLAAGSSKEVGGRGAYLCRRLECFENALERGSLERSLKGSGTKNSRADLLAWARGEFESASTAAT